MTGKKLSLLLITMVVLWSCYEKQEGCLDAFASNFDFEADENCCPDPEDDDCCCDFPHLQFTVKHLVGEANLVLGEPYLNDLGQLYIIESVAFFTSGYAVEDDSWYGVDDTVEINTGNGEVHSIADDATQISRNAFEFPAGKFLRPGSYQNLTFSLGLSEILNSADTADFLSDHPLRPSNNALYIDSVGYLMYRVGLITDTTSAQVRFFYEPAFPPDTLTMPITAEKDRGQNLSIPVEVDYGSWFNGIDFNTDSDEQITRKIRQGMTMSIQPVE